MFDANDLLKLIKKTAVEAVNASKPVNVVFGKVISNSPLKIKIDQKLILTSAQLILPKSLMANSPSEVFLSDTETNKQYVLRVTNGRLTMGEVSSGSNVKTSLKIGEEVILMQMSGGQKYVVIDRIEKG